MSDHAFVVESEAHSSDGKNMGTFRLYVATEKRAVEVAGAAPGRTWRRVALADLPPRARENLAKAAAAAAG